MWGKPGSMPITGQEGIASLTVTRGEPNITIYDGYDRSDIWPTPNPSRNISVPLMQIHTDGPPNRGSDHLFSSWLLHEFSLSHMCAHAQKGRKKNKKINNQQQLQQQKSIQNIIITYQNPTIYIPNDRIPIHLLNPKENDMYPCDESIYR